MRIAMALALLAYTPALATTVPPRDDCLRLDGYHAFRQELESIVKNRDTARLLSLTADTIEWNFNGEPGKTGFAAAFELTKGDGKASALWPLFEQMLPLGCGIEQGGIAFPYLYTAQFDAPNGADPFAAGVVIGNGVNLRQHPSIEAKVLTKLSWEVIERLTENDPAGWDKVRTTKGETGYIRTDLVRSATDYRAGFVRRDGRWQMIYFVAGD